jgi:hypothetical protein
MPQNAMTSRAVHSTTLSGYGRVFTVDGSHTR